jgi:hypothetical protein
VYPPVCPSFLPFGERGDEFLQKSGMPGASLAAYLSVRLGM